MLLFKKNKKMFIYFLDQALLSKIFTLESKVTNRSQSLMKKSIVILCGHT